MRVISQCGRGDFPYEQISLVIRNFGQPDQWLIVAHGLYFKDDLGTRIAEYSTEENAKKAMDLLHESYTGVRFVSIPDNSISFEDLIKECEKGVITVPASKEYPAFGNYDGCCVFKFPSENEVKCDKSKAI